MFNKLSWFVMFLVLNIYNIHYFHYIELNEYLNKSVNLFIISIIKLIEMSMLKIKFLRKHKNW